MRTNVDLAAIPPVILIVLGALLLVQVTLTVVALVNLYRRPAAAVATGNKWLWAAVIILLSFIGPILYFAIGRKQSPMVDLPSAAQQRSSADIAAALYGDDETPRHT